MVALIVVSVVLILEEQFFRDAVCGECDSCDSESGEGSLEAVPP